MPDFSPIWIVVFLPLLGALIQGVAGPGLMAGLGRKVGRPMMGVLACLPILAAFGITLGLTFSLAGLKPEEQFAVVKVFDWINIQSLNIPFELRVDGLSMTMALIVTGIGGLIHIYATGYMADETDFTRFFTYLNLFIAFMLVLVLGNNLGLLFIGWEGVGACSYLLIGFWYKDLQNSKAANKAFIANRIGDVGLALGMFFLIYILAGNREALGITDARWLSYDVIVPAAEKVFRLFPNETTIICLLFFVGAMGKSAQFPLYVWLPDAMAGPTPVSALIHAATMVTSGVILLNRMSPFFIQSPVAMSVVAMVGALTALIGAAIAFGQTDIKKVLAFSTVSQLGYMFIGCGVGVFHAGLMHVITHAFFKALLFLGSGSVIYAMAHCQDMRSYGGLQKHIKITYVLMGIGFLAIAGVPFLFSGFWSKEAILGPAVNDHVTLMSFIPGLTWGGLAGWIGFLVAAMTAFYMTRMMALTFGSGPERWLELAPAHAHGHADHHDHAHHAGHDDHHHDHGPDQHGFFYSDDEMTLRHSMEEHEHHHELDSHHKPKEVPIVMWLALVPLAFGSLGFVGYALEHDHWLQHWLYPMAHAAEKGAKHAVSHEMLIALSFITSFAGILGALAVYWKKLPASEGYDMSKWNPMRKAALNQFGIDWLFSDGLSNVARAFGKVSKWIDENIIEGLVQGFGILANFSGAIVRSIQRGKVREYALLMQIGAAVLAVAALLLMTQGGAQ